MKVTQKVQDELAQLRKAATHLSEEHKREVYARVPQVEALERQRVALAYELCAPCATMSDNAHEQYRIQIQENMNALQSEIIRLMAQAGYPSDYMLPKYTCPLCDDTGYCGYPTRKMCKCMEQRLIEDMYASSNIDRAQTFDTCDLSVFSDDVQRKIMTALFDKLKRYAAALPKPVPMNLLLIGATGLGKTFALNCVAHEAIERGYSVIKITAYNIINSVMHAISERETAPDFTSCDLLFIDDLGTEPMIPNITIETLLTIINERETRSLATVIATNLSPQDIFERYSDRIYSRLVAPMYTEVLLLKGNDVRLKSNK